MAFYDIFLPNSIPRHSRRVADRDAQAEDREGSFAWLSENGTPDALLALCGRFNLHLEHNLKDRKEKETVMDYLAEHGDLGAAAARKFCFQSVNFQNAIRVVERIKGESAATDLLLELLAAENVEEEFKVEKKRNLLISLAERKDPRIVAASAPFLADFDEGVRNAAVEALAAQDGDSPRESLFAALTRAREESTRIRGRIAEVFATRRWSVGGNDWLLANIPNGFRHADGRLISER